MAARQELQVEPRRVGRDPFALMREMTADVDRLFGTFTWPLQWPALRGLRGEEGWHPRVDVFQRENFLVTKVDLPGLNKEDVKVEVAEGQLTIAGERKRETEEKKEGFYRAEREYGTFFRTVPLPEGVKVEEVKATFANGVLEVTVPLPQFAETKPRTVKVEEAPAAAAKTAA
jgi:HSP20 family protein